MNTQRFFLVLLFNLAWVWKSIGQIDDYGSGFLEWSYGAKTTNHDGILFFAPKDLSTGRYIEPYDYASFRSAGPTMDVRYTSIAEDRMISANLSGLVFFVGDYFSKKNDLESAFNPFVAQQTDELSESDFPTLTKSQRYFQNFSLIELTSTFGNHPIKFGFSYDWRFIGYRTFTYYERSGDQTFVVQAEPNQAEKMMLGPAMSYSKSINNFAVNASAGIRFSANTEPFIAMKYNGFLNSSLYYGKRAGLCLHFNFEVFKGKDKDGYHAANFNANSLRVGIYFIPKSE